MNPQQFNRYTYSLNNPLKYWDPSGHAAVCGTSKSDCGGTPPPPSSGEFLQEAVQEAVDDAINQIYDPNRTEALTFPLPEGPTVAIMPLSSSPNQPRSPEDQWDGLLWGTAGAGLDIVELFLIFTPYDSIFGELVIGGADLGVSGVSC